MRGLERRIGLGGVFCVAAGAMISSGVFVLPGIAHAMAGPAVVLSYLLAGALASIGVMCVAEIVTAMPKAGGDYFFISRTLGPAVGTVAGLLSWFSLSLKSGFALAGLTAFAQPLLPFDPRFFTLSILAVFMVLNLLGAHKTAAMQNALVLLLLGAMLLYAVMGVGSVEAARLTPFAPYGWDAVFSVAGVVFISYGGLLNIAAVAEEIDDPGRTVPRGMALALGVVTVLYVLCVFVTTGVLPSARLDHSLTPLSDGAAVFMGSWGGRLLGAAAVLAFVSTANAGILSASRYLLALARDERLPSFLGRVSPRFGAPTAAVLVTSALIGAAELVELTVLVKAASAVLILTYALACLCVIVLRESGIANYRPVFRTPLYPWLPLAGVLGPVLLLGEMGHAPLLTAVGLAVAGVVFFVAMRHARSASGDVEHGYALLHLAERLMGRRVGNGLLEGELREIVRQREGMVHDRFDFLVERALVLDVDGRVGYAELFDLISNAVEKGGGPKAELVRTGLTGCCNAGIDVIMPGVAVAEVIVPDHHPFELTLVRVGEGADFPNGTVRAFFLMLSGRDEHRSFVPAVASLAQVVIDLSFMERWLAAKDAQGQRDTILLAKRHRFHL